MAPQETLPLHSIPSNSTVGFEKDKGTSHHIEHLSNKVLLAAIDEKHQHDAALNILGDGREEMTDEQSRIVRWKIDKTILPILFWIYLLQILDKFVVGYSAVLGLQADTHLIGNQYSLLGSVGYWAQLAWQPFSAFIIVRVPTKLLMTFLVFAWGCSVIGLAFSRSYAPLMACRFLLGLFEAGIVPLFSIVTTTWYRRSEQPVRMAIWYSTTGFASMFGSLLAWGLSFAPQTHLYTYQIIFLTVGLITVLSSSIIWFRLADNPAVAYFLTEDERRWAVERLRDNNTGVEVKEIKWNQIVEALASPINWLFVFVELGTGAGASVPAVFGPIIIRSIGFTGRTTLLLNIPYGFVQIIAIASSILLAARWKRKAPILIAVIIPCIIGAAMLYAIGRGKQYAGPLLLAYYFLGVSYAAPPLILSWMTANTGGATKRSITLSMFQWGNAAGNIVGPLLFKSTESPVYKGALKNILIIFVASAVATIMLFFTFVWMNRRKMKQRVTNGKPERLEDRSLERNYVAGKDLGLGDNAFLDMTDWHNDEFIYVL